MRIRTALFTLLLLVPLTGCVTYPPGWDRETEGPDPYQGANRAFWSFNDGVDTWILSPIATAWEFITFEAMRESIDRFFDNLAFPGRALSNLGQGKVGGAGNEVGRFFVNTTVGVVGLFDPAKHLGMPPGNEDFGQMFGAWGMGPGPYWVVPLLGPSNPRDFAGGVLDTMFDLSVLFTVFAVPATGIIEVVNARALADEQIDTAKEISLDYYAFVRDAYLSRRRALVADLDEEDETEFAEQEPAQDDSIYDDSLYDESIYDEPADGSLPEAGVDGEVLSEEEAVGATD